MAAIEMTGLASGMDTKSIVNQLMEIERRPIYLKQNEINKVQTEKKHWQEIGTQVKAFRTTAIDMNLKNPFNKKIASVSDEKILSVEIGPNAKKGTYVLEDVKLAKAGSASSDGRVKFSGGIDSNITSDRLNIKGVNTKFIDMFMNPINRMKFSEIGFKINGKEISIDSGDTLGTFINKINDSDAGVKASFNPEDKRFRIESTNGKALEMDATDKSFLRELKISQFAGGKTDNLVQPDYKKKLFTVSGLSDVQRGFFTINDYTVEVNPSADSLETIVAKLNKSGSPVKAIFDGESGKMSIVASKPGDDLVFQDDTTNLMRVLGFANPNNKATIYEGQKASFVMDGVKYERSSNDVTLDGMKINLKSNTPMGERITLKIDNDVDGMVQKIKKFVEDYNKTVEIINKKTEKDGPLQGNTTANTLSNNLRTYMANSVNGLESQYSQLALIGIGTTGKEATLQINEEKLRKALGENPAEVEKLFLQMSSGKGNERVSIGDGDKTKFTPTNYNVTDINNIQIKVGDRVYKADDDKYRIMKRSELPGIETDRLDIIKQVVSGEIRNKFDLEIKQGKRVPDNVVVIDDVTGAMEFGKAPGRGEEILIETNKKLSKSNYGLNEGIAIKVENYLKPMAIYNGTLDRQSKAIDDRVRQMNDWIARTEDRLKMREEALKSQFSTMEGSINYSNSQSNWLRGQISQLGG